MKSFFPFCALLCSISASCLGQMASPDVKCVAVQGNGDVVLTWIIPSNNGFVSYHVDTSSSPATIPFATYTTVTSYSSTAATHIGAGANSKRMYYRVFTESTGPSFSLPKDTFSTIYLAESNSGGNAVLSWNKISNQPISTSKGWYKIYREYPAGNWMLRDSTTNLTYTDITDVCNKNNDSINYRVEIGDNTGCVSVSRVFAGDTLLTDKTSPIVSKIDTVSVNTTLTPNRATISWNPSLSKDADSVIIYKLNSPAWQQIASVKTPQTFFTYSASLAASTSETFRIAFKDSCGNLSAMGTEHKTIYLSVNFDICAATAVLIWNKYINMNGPVSQYKILKSVNAGPFTTIATNLASDTDYVDTGLTLGNAYCYLVRATNGSKTSSSNEVCITTNVNQPPQFTYNRYATVVSDKSIKVAAYVDPSPGVSYYRLQRATGTGGSFTTLKTLPKFGNSLNYTDDAVMPGNGSYSYRWQAMNSCDQVIMTSDTAVTMHLTALMAPYVDIVLSWNDYSAWAANVDRYEVYRAVDGMWSSSPIASIPFTGNGGTYTDDVSPFLSSKGVFSYYVVALEDTGNPYGFRDSSASNIASVYEYPKFYIPNAFTPNGDGTNDTFLPVIGFIDPAEYSITIFDMTGTPIMTSISPDQGWDGKKKGHPCQEGVYMYLILCRASNGKDSRISGTVSLIR